MNASVAAKNLLACALLICAAKNAVAERELPLQRTEPEHLERSTTLRAPRTSMDWVEPARLNDGVIYRFAKPIADFDPIIGRNDFLTALCRVGQFGQVIPMRLRAVDGTGTVYGLVFGSGGSRSNLHDPGGVARDDQIYLIDRQDTGACTVWAGLLNPVRQLAGFGDDE